MSEVVILQLIGLSVVGLGIVILLFIRAQFARVIGFVAMVSELITNKAPFTASRLNSRSR